MLELIRQELIGDFGDTATMVRVVVRLTIAVILGGVVGFERQYEHKSAGVRTHMLVALGSALFTLVSLELLTSDVGRVMQGVATGIGFLGAGVIFKSTDNMEVKGLTTAASVWVTAAAGLATGAGRFWAAGICVAMAWIILYLLHRVERWLKHLSGKHRPAESQPR